MSAPDATRAALVAAAREFNAGRYFEAHEALEEALEDVPDASWSLFLGLIQIAVGYHKLTQELWSGAARMLAIGLSKIAPYSDDAAGIALAALRERAGRDLAALRSRTFDPSSLATRPPRLVPRATGRSRRPAPARPRPGRSSPTG